MIERRATAENPNTYSGEIEISKISEEGGVNSEDDPRKTKTPQKPDFKEYESAI